MTYTLTFHRAVNHGAWLQAYALQRTLDCLGVANSILDWQTRADILRNQALSIAATGDRPLASLVPALRKAATLRSAQRHLKSTPRAKRYNSKMTDVGVLIVGSDEVWNVDGRRQRHRKLFFGRAFPAAEKYAYAVSVGQSTPRTLSAYAGDIREFNGITVRDSHSANVVEAVAGVRPARAVDPVLLYDFSAELQSHAAAQSSRPPACIVYAVRPSAHFVDGSRSLAAATGLPLVSLGYYNSWATQNTPDVSPLALLAEIRQASLVITNTLHGLIMALKFRRPTYFSYRHGKEEKMRGMLELLGIRATHVHMGESAASMWRIDEADVDASDLENAIHESRDTLATWVGASPQREHHRGMRGTP